MAIAGAIWTVISGMWGLVLLVPLRLGRAVGITNAPYICLGGPTLVALDDDDPRPVYHSWWHLECMNKQRGRLASVIPTKDAEGCRVRIAFKPLFSESATIADDGVFLLGTSQPPSEIATLPVGRLMPVPLYCQARTGMAHPTLGVPLKDGIYVTGAQFLWHAELVERQRLAPGTYEITVTVTWNRRSFVRKWVESLQPLQQPQPSVTVSPPPRKRSEVVSDGVRWRHTGEFYAGDPAMDALCPKADFAIEIMVKTPYGDELKPVSDSDVHQVGVYQYTRGPYRLWCPGLGKHHEHEISLVGSQTWDEARVVAQRKLKAQIEIDRDRATQTKS